MSSSKHPGWRMHGRLFTALLVVYPLLFIWQGLDFTDTGYSLTNARWFFTDPGGVQFRFFNCLTNFIGGLWHACFGFLGVLGFKIAAVLVVYAIMGLCHPILRGRAGAGAVPFVLLLSMMFIIKADVRLLNYNTLTSLFLVLSGVLLFRGLRSKSNASIFASAAAAGLAVFIRLPNLPSLLLCSCIVYHGLRSGAERGDIFFGVVVFLSGYVLSLIAAVAILKATGRYELYTHSLMDYLTAAQSPEFHHGAPVLLKSFLKDYFYAFSMAGLSLSALFMISIPIARIERERLRDAAVLLTCVAATAILQTMHSWKWIYTGAIHLLLLPGVFNRTREGAETGSLALISLLILVIAPLGSRNGMWNAVHGMWLAMPLALMGVLRMRPFEIRCTLGSGGHFGLAFKEEHTALVRKTILLTTVMCSLSMAYFYTYRDSPHRLDMRHGVDHPMLRGTFTTRERSEVVEDLLRELAVYCEPRDALFCFEQIPLVHFLTETRPWLYNPWPMLYMPGQLEAALASALGEHPSPPVFVRAISSVSNCQWPDGARGLPREDRFLKNRGIVQRFLMENDYVRRWENSMFEIWTPRTFVRRR